MVRLTRLKIDRFRNVKPGTDLRFAPTFNTLLGKNATGKSTLLDLVAAVTNDDLSAYAKEDAGFDLTWWLEKGEDQLERRAMRAPTKSAGPGERLRGESEFDDAWTMVHRTKGVESHRVEVVGAHGIWKFPGDPDVPFDTRDSVVTVRAGLGAVLAGARRFPRKQGWMLVPLMVQMLDVQGVVGRFDEALAWLDAITQLPFDLHLEGGQAKSFAPWVPKDFLSAIDARTPLDLVARSLDEIESLRGVPAILGFVAAELRPRMLRRSQNGEKVTVTYQGFDCLFRRADGSQISHQFLSFGQKRLFSFLWYLAVRDQLPVVADELFNGLHHQWIEVCLDRLYDRQSFLATQHPYLLDHIPIESEEGVRTTFIRCTLERGEDGREQMVWRNFDEGEAERFFIAYQTGIQQVSEVLRTEGLW